VPPVGVRMGGGALEMRLGAAPAANCLAACLSAMMAPSSFAIIRSAYFGLMALS